MADRFERVERQSLDAELISIEDAERLRAIALSIVGQPGVHSYISQSSGAEHHVAYATALLPDSKTSMGLNVPEFFIQSRIEGDATMESWRALVSVLTYTEQFNNYNVRQVYDVAAESGRVTSARYRKFSVYDAKDKTFQTLVDELVEDCRPADFETGRSLREMAIQPEHIDSLKGRIENGLLRVAKTSFRVVPPNSIPSKVRVEHGHMPGKNTESDPRFCLIETNQAVEGAKVVD